MPKGLISKDYVVLVTVAAVVAVLLLGIGAFQKTTDWAGWIQAIGLIVGLMMAITVPAIQKKQHAGTEHIQMREREIGFSRRMQYLCAELTELLIKINVNLVHLRATDRHRLQHTLQDYLHRLFESHKQDLNDDRVVIAHELRQVVNELVDELESGRADRGVLMNLDKRLQKLVHKTQVNATMAERL
ncbi:hypothetical protein QN382_08350 [Pseudomonas sp. 10B1]|uniref:hypothetical protein n=1 Tax=unclassified Pseudomonas TaxID=196821 RepID=UPI002AB5B0B7|nr:MULTISPECIES: hypothetical protein [unclassified Pseudomonas]MDY7559865.1 hypothetical protein [Pseudomonas sp. AB6]MEA9977846.1 hypothetical protein [Pseudomonas sp. RTS4]MEA9992891.1 hypothetical protein [Pseudomonas sp. AA4]MEB0088289.1 hypothetical protein [Pseudomonas sp. RTI1]MEB0125731.1 hypothetical protein [Pseudomonas sp. CCC1.2]